MKILKIEAHNIIGLKRAEIVCGQPITLVAGDNEAGKSSLVDAVSMALRGEPKRVKLKKDIKQLMHNDAKKGSITLLGADDEVLASFSLPAGKHELGASIEKHAGYDFLPLVIDPHAFTRLDEKERRSTLFKLTGCSAKPDYIMAELKKAGCNEAFAERIIGMARAGFPAMAEEAKKLASEARGVWQQATGETWGSEKAEGWEVDIPAGKEVAQADIDKAAGEAHSLQHKIEEGIAFRAKTEGELQRAQSYDEQLASLTEKASGLERANAKLDATSQELDRQVAQRNKLNAQLGTAPTCACPHCGGAVVIVGQGLKDGSASPTAAERKQAQTELAAVTDAIAMLERTRANDQRAVREAEAAEHNRAELAANKPEAIADDLLQRTDDAITELRQLLATANAKRQALQERFELAAGAARTNEIAAAKHAEIMAWKAIETELLPAGIPSRLLEKAIAPVNTALEVMARLTGWSVPRVEQDMSLTYGGRDYGLCSESAKWRFDVMISLVVAQISTLKFIVIDRLDVLSVKHRPKLAGLLLELTKAGNLDSAILCGTMKAAPEMPPGFQSLWIEKGVVLSEGIE